MDQHPNNEATAEALKFKLHDLSFELKEPLRAAMHKLLSASYLEDIFPVYFSEVLTHFAILTGGPSSNKARLYRAILQSSHPRVFKTRSVIDGDLELFKHRIAEFPQRHPVWPPAKKSLLLAMCEEVDRSNGTDFGQRVANMMIEIAYQAATADGPLSPAAESELIELRRVLDTGT